MTVRALALTLLLTAGLAPAARADGTAAQPPAAPASTPAPQDKAEAPADPNDLGRGLRYFRATALAADLATLEPALAAGPLVLDLRASQGDASAIARLQELLQRRTAAADRPLFVLLAADTPAAVRAAVPAAPPIVTLGCAGPGYAPAVAVSTDSARDRAAVAALAAGRPVRELIEEKIDKTRYDEALLVRNHANGRRPTEGAPPPAAPKDKPAAADAPEPPLQDLVLQRAVFLHRALLALGRLPQKD